MRLGLLSSLSNAVFSTKILYTFIPTTTAVIKKLHEGACCNSVWYGHFLRSRIVSARN